jgi:hypothetical protein
LSMELIKATYAIVTLHNNVYNKGPHCVKAGNLSEIVSHGPLEYAAHVLNRRWRQLKAGLYTWDALTTTVINAPFLPKIHVSSPRAVSRGGAFLLKGTVLFNLSTWMSAGPGLRLSELNKSAVVVSVVGLTVHTFFVKFTSNAQRTEGNGVMSACPLSSAEAATCPALVMWL